ncbi:putative LRR receptor-like serine/threonine-protein kinase [Dichanthelium oligosanthes]|uniref:non-specific serine/threonine protein kinase n=1 Tax=Dichanthelium oligosanthes TaxID=888268 RepID=A0A1E5WDG4_9POAL|nr:putative LRR receptor-like serine/threonine-protein kinase [Dichanthelium oligosanthes]
MALFCIAMVLLISSLTPCAAALTPTPPSNSTDVVAMLLAFKAQLKDPSGVLAGNWTATASLCSWVGVSCGRGGRRVVGLRLKDVPLQGSIAPQLGNLSFLSSLVLLNTSLVGPVPDELGSLRRLQTLILSGNGLSGTIPRTLGNLTRLKILHLGTNSLSGGIPQELQNLHSLQDLRLQANGLVGPIPQGLFNNTPNVSIIHLGSNRLTGEIPDCVATLSNLVALVLEENHLSGTMPPGIFNMSQLKRLYVSNNNNLSGPIPENESFHLPMLEDVFLDGNQFSGLIPWGLSGCQNLVRLALYGNRFIGSVPSWLATLPNLIGIYFSTNELTGNIPVELSNHTGLISLDLSENKLQGEIPPELGRLTNLEYLSFAGNQITGVIPESIGNLSNLAGLDLFGNGLTGSVPLSFGNLPNLLGIFLNLNQLSGNLNFLTGFSNSRSLNKINIANNAFTGRLPPSIGNLSTVLQIFVAENNRISGSIPSTVANLSNLLMLSLNGNNLSGKIPTPITAMNNLQELELSDNSLSGAIPAEICGLTSLVNLHLDRNKLVGSIPSSITSLSQLQHMTFSENSLSSTIPKNLWHLQKLIELDLSKNSLSGYLPADLGKLTAISTMDLSGNQLSGDIPVSFGALNMMISLNLSSNLLQGSIPDSLGNLLNIQDLDLSSNVLSGAIPKSLATLTYLANLNLSYNKLNGQIPEGGVFSNITIKSLMGNNELCGLPNIGIAPCQNNTNHSRSKQLLLKVLLPAAVAIFISASFLYRLVSKSKNKKGNMPLPPGTSLQSYQLISYHELVRATSNFSDDNLLGAGSFGKVFKGQLQDESVVAIKVFNMQHESADKSFDIECRALRMARHRNLVKIISTCSNLDFKALILEYMPNGSLDDWLYSNDGCQLSFLQRVSIMLDVATAIEYLHHQHFDVILHCDLKPSNILLNKDMVAHISDFGISKLLVGDDSFIATSIAGTLGYTAPEFGSTGKASRASDIYSYGIVLLEVFTRKKPTDPMFVGELSLRQWVSQAFPYELSNVVDCSILQGEPNYDIEGERRPPEDSTILTACLASIIDLALLCSRASPGERIPMNDIVVKLNKIKTNYGLRPGNQGGSLGETSIHLNTRSTNLDYKRFQNRGQTFP